MELELKHLAPYLPYGLKCIDGELIGISNHIGWSGIFKAIHGSNHIPICGIKPILRPLSDLTKEIEVNGEKFVPIEYFEDKYYTLDLHKQCHRLLENEDWIYQTNFMLINYLLKWHFDIFGLIENNLAININDNR